jgi:hypothetical protein
MFIYIVEQAEQVSSRYHSGGGISIVAESPEAALELANKTPDVSITAADIAGSTSYELVGLPEPKVFIFPNAGCC